MKLSVFTWVVTVKAKGMFDKAVESHDILVIYHLIAVIHVINQFEKYFIIKEARDGF